VLPASTEHQRSAPAGEKPKTLTLLSAVKKHLHEILSINHLYNAYKSHQSKEAILNDLFLQPAEKFSSKHLF